MKIDFRKIAAGLGQTVRRFPVESGILLYAFVFAALVYEEVIVRHEANLLLIPFFFALAFVTDQLAPAGRWRWAYFLCWVPMPLLWMTDPEAWVSSLYYPVTLGISLLAVFACRRRTDNAVFAAETLRYFFNAVIAAVFAGVAHLLLIAIYFSVHYIFNVWGGWETDFLVYSSMLAYIVALPLMFLAFTRGNLGDPLPPNRIFDILLNYILTPALLVYTAILYLYLLKIAFEWSLPKGGLAYMVFAFTMIAVVAKACQPLLGKRIYGWYFDRFSLIALPAAAMFWIGTLYRIGEYGFTEARVYLMVCGLVMTLTLGLLLFRRAGRYLYVTLGAMFLFALFTYVPPLSAERIALRSQSERVASIAASLGLLDEEGEFRTDPRPLSDTVYREQYLQLYESLRYLYREGAPMRGLSAPDVLKEVYPGDLDGYGRMAALNDFRHITAEGAVFDIGGYTRFYPMDGYRNDTTAYYYTYTDDTLALFRAGKKLWSSSGGDLLEGQLRKIGFSRDSIPGEEVLNARRSEFMSLRRDGLLLLFDQIGIASEGGIPGLQYIHLGGVMTRESAAGGANGANGAKSAEILPSE